MKETTKACMERSLKFRRFCICAVMAFKWKSMTAKVAAPAVCSHQKL